jgi:hypothetical protein
MYLMEADSTFNSVLLCPGIFTIKQVMKLAYSIATVELLLL